MTTRGKLATSVLLIIVLLSTSAGALQPGGRTNLAPVGDGEIVLVARDLIDLKWDPSTYPTTGTFLRWELYRGTAADSLSRIYSGLDQSEDFYRDEGLAVGPTYYYRLDVVRCVAPCGGPSDERTYTVFSDSATSGLFQGTVVKNLTLDPGYYDVGFAGVDSSAAVYITENAILTISENTTVRLASGITSSSIHTKQGALNVDGTTFEKIGLAFGDYYDESTAGQGSVINATINDATISLNAQSDVLIQRNKGNFSIYLNQYSNALILDNQMEGIIEVDAAASATIKRNHIANGRVNVSGYGSPSENKAFALISGNTITNTYQNQGVSVSYGATAEVTDNWIQWTGYHGSESSVLVDGSDAGTNLIVKRNTIVNGKVGAFWNANIDITDNVIRGGGAAITVGCIVCGTGIQAIGNIERNTLEYGWGLEMWAGSQELYIRHNCIRGNDPGLTTDDTNLTKEVDARYNWWGSDSGPTHPSNPGGRGDRIDGNMVLFSDWDHTDMYCLTQPPPPPTDQPSTLNLTPTPDSIPPDGHATSDVWAEVLDDEGQALEGLEVNFTILPNDRGDQLGGIIPTSCTTDSIGRCKIGYVAPWPNEAYKNGVGEGSVTIEANAGSLVAETDIVFIYLRVTHELPVNTTRNIDWTQISPYAIFDRTIDPASVSLDTFKVYSSIYYRSGFACQYLTAGDHVLCSLDLSDLQAHPNADKGLIVTAEFKGGPNGVHAQDGTYLQRSFVWRFYTTPKLYPEIIPVQISESDALVGSREAVVRIKAGLHEDTELDWVEADISLTYDGTQNYQRPSIRFYQGDIGYGAAMLKGNSANFYSRDNQVPIVGEGSTGAHQISVDVTPSNQANPPLSTPRKFSATKSIEVRDLGFHQRSFTVIGHPIAPSHLLVGDSYQWESGERVYNLRESPVVKAGAEFLYQLFPLYKIPLYQVGDIVTSAVAPEMSMSDPAYLPRLARLNGYVLAVRVDAVILFMPGNWMRDHTNGDNLFHQVINHVCLVAGDANIATLAHCIGHLYGLNDIASWTLKGYDLGSDRYVDSEYPNLGYSLGVMGANAGKYTNSQIPQVWIDRNNYNFIFDAFTPSSTQLNDEALSNTVDTIPLALGGEVQLSGSATSGLIDIVEMPAANPSFPQPGGSGDYHLHIKDSHGTTLETHTFSPIFETLSDGREYASFLFTLDAPTETHQVELLHGNTVLHTVTASQNAPQVSISQPSGGNHSGTIQVSWNASDADSSSNPRSRAFYSTDDGLSWAPLSLETYQTSLNVDTTQFANCQMCRIQVIVDDGFHSAEALSAPFSVTNPPRVSRVWPTHGSSDAGSYTQITAAFRDNMNAGTIHAGNFTLIDGYGSQVVGVVSYDDENQVATFSPNNPLQNGLQYVARLSGNIENEAGLSLGSDYTWNFQIENGPFPIYLPSINMQ